MVNMINKFLERFGYVKKADLSVNELSMLLARYIGDPFEYTINKKEEEKMFNDLSGIDGFGDYLRATCAKDMQRYFGATDDVQRHMARGAFTRTIFLHKNIKSAPRKIVEGEKPKLNGSRYA